MPRFCITLTHYFLFVSATVLPTALVAQDEYLRTFSEKHYQGDQNVYTPLLNHRDLEKFDNRISSLSYKLPPGRVCALYLDKNYEGAILELHGTGYRVEIPDLGLYSRNISSLRWDANGGQISNPQGAFARVYERDSFGGRRLTVVFNQNIPDLRRATDEDGREGFDNLASSARWLIPSGWNLVLYKNRNYEGDAVELRGSGVMDATSSFDKFGSKASSLRWEPTRPGGALGTFPIPQSPR